MSTFSLMQFSGGALRFRLAEGGGRIAEWATNEYGVPVTIDVVRETSNLDPVRTIAPTVVLPAHQAVLIGEWEASDDLVAWSERSKVQFEWGATTARPSPYVYALPFAAGDGHRLIQGFHGAFSHTGDSEFAVDFEMPEGTTIRAARDGTIVAFHDTATTHGLTPEFLDPSHGNWIYVLHADGTLGLYLHLAPHGVRVRIGQVVARGDVLGSSGFTGYAGVPHLHFAVMTAANGTHARTFPFTFSTSPGDHDGKAPVDGATYTAFE